MTRMTWLLAGMLGLGAMLWPTATLSANRQFQILDVTFTDAQHIWSLGLPCGAGKCSTMAFQVSSDGGRSWHAGFVIPAQPRFAGKSGTVARVGGLRFVTERDAYAFGPSLLTSHNGGRSWTWERSFRDVVALEPVGSQVWAVQDLCFRAGACPIHLFRSAAARDGWQRSALPLRSPSGPVQIVAGRVAEAWILASQQPAHGPYAARSALIQTRDGGRSWQHLPDPCSPSLSFIDRLATMDGRYLWLVCGSEPSAGGELFSLYRSPDEGRRWRLIASNTRAGVPRFVYGGYVDSLAVTGPSTAWFSLDRGTLYRTTDGGRHWVRGIHQTVSDSTVGPVLFSGPLHGWLASFPSTIFRTTDGGRSWHGVVLR